MDHREAYRSYDPSPYYRERGWVIGGGSVGGKGKGLAFAHESLLEDGLGCEIRLPEITLAVGTHGFEEFERINGIFPLVDEIPYDELERKILDSPLPPSISRELDRVLDTLTGPLAVRSSSLLEDDIELSFAGKYATRFVANLGDRSSRLAELERAIKSVFASTYNPAAREYQRKHKIPLGQEKMAVLIQPLQGKRRGDLFYPEMAITAFSCVFRRPSPRIDKNDGVIRLCFGMGTHTVGRSFARTFYLTNPQLRPEGGNAEQIYLYAQKDFDYVDMDQGLFMTSSLIDGLSRIERYHKMAPAFVEWYDDGMLYWLHTDRSNLRMPMPCFSFTDLPRRCHGFFDRTKRMLAFFEGAMGFPVDVEAVYESDEDLLTLVQLRPLASYMEFGHVDIPDDVPEERVVLKGNRMVTNHVRKGIRRLVYVDPDLYGESGDFAEVARAVGVVNQELEGERYILVGPGRWGSTNPTLGVPVDYSEISNCGCMVEVGIPKRGMIPELSYGTHFFLDLDVDEVLYLPVIEGEHENLFSRGWFEGRPFEPGGHPAVRIYEGVFDVYLDGEDEIGVVFDMS
ncbi:MULTISPECIES: PEP/pyruvate-binding domain-containing protein [Dethiosulfovibrio]|uniref:PEP/pyruvate-binding domain-containing protein n=2 Tax=Dethiosulfovibrio TaxID=47054 RepID=A0ABS9EPE4_9BACT|nr:MULTISPECIES: PEP/pyruvate-binding domain-containing protein [Dethiosulfovibrio]MCF4114755.1 PEP/pyruvate-binding domain-containing protein [Dethiosulfovibrio russensis]MCF4143040.1 PEP/pyruvate-binding domain-containing protein [Dethiosulfovibrio marinus]MCF4145260.1 PEP/pyruvate-binding domain-containing protein [Dethiosulfovibrio acidaminovorans]